MFLKLLNVCDNYIPGSLVKNRKNRSLKKSGDTSMSFKDKYIINQEFEDIFSFDSEKEELQK